MINHNNHTKPLSEKEFVEGCIRKEIRCEKLLYDTYAPKMFTMCLRYAGDYHLAQDILQESFIKVFQHLGQFRFEGSFEGWVRRIVVSTAIRNIKLKMRVIALEDMDKEKTPEADAASFTQLSAKDLMNIIQSMPSGYRTVFNLYVFEELSHKEIAQMLEIEEGTSKSQLAKARKFLQEKIDSLNNYKLATHA